MSMVDDVQIQAEARRRRQRQRNIALAFVLLGLVATFYVITLVKGVPLIVNRPM